MRPLNSSRQTPRALPQPRYGDPCVMRNKYLPAFRLFYSSAGNNARTRCGGIVHRCRSYTFLESQFLTLQPVKGLKINKSQRSFLNGECSQKITFSNTASARADRPRAQSRSPYIRQKVKQDRTYYRYWPTPHPRAISRSY